MTSIFRDYKKALVGAQPNVRYFFVASFLSQLGSGFFSVLYNLYIRSMGMPDTVAGDYVAATAIATTIALVPAGLLSDRVGRKTAVLVAGGLNGIILVGQAFASVPWFIILGAALSGAVSSVIQVSVLPLLAENTQKEERFHLFSVNFALGLVAQVVGSVGSGLISQSLNHVLSPLASLRITMLVGAAMTFFALIPFSRISHQKRVDEGNENRLHLRGAIQHLRKERTQFQLIVKFVVSQAIIGFGAGLVIPYLNLYFAERFHMTRAEIGLVIGAAQAVTAIAMVIGPAMANRFGPVRAAVAFQLCSIPFLLTTGYATNAFIASGAVVFRNALMNCASPIQDSIMMALVSSDLRGLAVSAGQALWNLGWAVMGPISTNIVHHEGAYTGYAIVFSGTALLYLTGSLLYRHWFIPYEKQVL